MLARTTHTTLLVRLSAREDGAWREFCERYGELIRGFARRRGCSENDADDVLQDVLTALVKVMPSFRYDPAKGRFRGYLKTVALRAIARRRCQNGDEMRLEDCEGTAVATDDPAADAAWEAEWRQYHVRLAMVTIDSEFAAHDRAAFRRYALEGHGVRETSEAIGVSVDQVYQAKSRILKRLTELVAAQVAEEG